jgi:hypothetical protein
MLRPGPEVRPSIIRKAAPVSICIAAIAEKAAIVGASDRMLTAGTGIVEFEPEQSKIWYLTPSIVAMMAGDLATQTELLKPVAHTVSARVALEPDRWWNVRDVAELYRDHYLLLRRKMAESAVLFPLGLDLDSYLNKQKDMDSSLVARLASDLAMYEGPKGVATLFVGVDNDGPRSNKGERLNYPHLYECDGPNVICFDSAGFAAIGIGRDHAESLMMFSEHWANKSISETLLLVYSAKKRAEVAPGVGKSTDMITIGPNLGSFSKVADEHLKTLNRIYEKSTHSAAAATRRAQNEVRYHIEKIAKENAAKGEAAKTECANPADTKQSSPREVLDQH